MRTAAGWLYVLAGLSGVGGLVAGGLLLAHSVQDCSDLVCTSTHPFVGAGAGVIAAAMIQAAVIVVIARLCEAVANLQQQGAAEQEPTYMPGSPMPTMYGTKD